MLSELEISKLWFEGQKIARKKLRNCYYPNCRETSIKKMDLIMGFSFNCYFNKHDKELFQKIGDKDVDFTDYLNCLLF